MIFDLFLESYSDHELIPGPSSWTDVAGDDYMSRNLETADVDGFSALDVAAFFAYAFISCICCCLWFIIARKQDEDYEREQEIRELEGLEAGETPPYNAQSTHASQCDTKKTTVEYMAFFSDAFENNKQQQTLLSSQLFAGDPTKAQGGEMNDKDQNLETVNSALLSARSYLSSDRNLPGNDTGDNDVDDDGDDSSVIAKNQTSSTRQNNSMCLFHPRGHGFDGKTKKIIGVHCTICLDDIEAEETIVWSETESCPHIFHKKCLVPFLAFNKERQLKLPAHRRQEVQNPCPTCRQSFVTLGPEVAWWEQ